MGVNFRFEITNRKKSVEVKSGLHGGQSMSHLLEINYQEKFHELVGETYSSVWRCSDLLRTYSLITVRKILELTLKNLWASPLTAPTSQPSRSLGKIKMYAFRIRYTPVAVLLIYLSIKVKVSTHNLIHIPAVS